MSAGSTSRTCHVDNSSVPHLLQQGVEPADVYRLPGHLVGQIVGLGALLLLQLAALQGRKTLTRLLHSEVLQRKGDWQLQQPCLRQRLLCMVLLRLALLQHRALLAGPANQRATDTDS